MGARLTGLSEQALNLRSNQQLGDWIESRLNGIELQKWPRTKVVCCYVHWLDGMVGCGMGWDGCVVVCEQTGALKVDKATLQTCSTESVQKVGTRAGASHPSTHLWCVCVFVLCTAGRVDDPQCARDGEEGHHNKLANWMSLNTLSLCCGRPSPSPSPYPSPSPSSVSDICLRSVCGACAWRSAVSHLHTGRRGDRQTRHQGA